MKGIRKLWEVFYRCGTGRKVRFEVEAPTESKAKARARKMAATTFNGKTYKFLEGPIAI